MKRCIFALMISFFAWGARASSSSCETLEKKINAVMDKQGKALPSLTKRDLDGLLNAWNLTSAEEDSKYEEFLSAAPSEENVGKILSLGQPRCLIAHFNLFRGILTTKHRSKSLTNAYLESVIRNSLARDGKTLIALMIDIKILKLATESKVFAFTPEQSKRFKTLDEQAIKFRQDIGAKHDEFIRKYPTFEKSNLNAADEVSRDKLKKEPSMTPAQAGEFTSLIRQEFEFVQKARKDLKEFF